MLELLLTLLCYLIGSMPTGLLVGRAAGLGDIRTVGSGNTGATNMVRAGGKKLGLITLLLDAFKGIIAVYIAYDVPTSYPALYYGLVATLGHCFPIWLKGKGGKGVATALGVLGTYYVLFPPSWPPILLLTALWIGSFALTRMVSFASLLTFAAAPALCWYFQNTWMLPLLLTLLIFMRHTQNMKRLYYGTEYRFGTTPR